MESTTGTDSGLTSQNMPPFAVTPAAFARIAHLLSGEPAGSVFRVAVDGGGCSGFQYRFNLEQTAPEASDLTVREGAAIVAVDEVSLGLLRGAALDYEEDLSSAGFVIRNPNATARCGCGNSFSVG